MRWALAALLVATVPACAQERPQLAAAEAARHLVSDYLAQGPAPWQPAPLGDTRAWKPDLVVAGDGSGTHLSVQAALDAVPDRARAARRTLVHVKPGVYREAVCAIGKSPFTIYGDSADPAAVRIVDGRYNAKARRAGADSANPCDPAPAATTYGTAGSATVALFSNDVQLAHLTVANDAMDAVHGGAGYPSGAGETGGAQAVALMTQGDRIQLENVRLLGHQDTFYVRAAPGAAARVHVARSLVAGDVDFVFGNATLVIEHCTLLSRAGRRAPGEGGYVLAPSTAAETRLGFLVSRSRLVGEPGLADGSIALGRAWDQGVARGTWSPGAPNGQALVRDSELGPHLGPWAASTSRRPFSAGGEGANRLAELGNRPLPK